MWKRALDWANGDAMKDNDPAARIITLRRLGLPSDKTDTTTSAELPGSQSEINGTVQCGADKLTAILMPPIQHGDRPSVPETDKAPAQSKSKENPASSKTAIQAERQMFKPTGCDDLPSGRKAQAPLTQHPSPSPTAEQNKVRVQREKSNAVVKYNLSRAGEDGIDHAVADAASSATKVLLVMNGGASFGILMFVAIVVRNATMTGATAGGFALLLLSLDYFVIGMGAIGLAAGLAYAAELIRAEFSNWAHQKKVGCAMRWIRIGLTVVSLIEFGVGSASGIGALNGIGINSTTVSVAVPIRTTPAANDVIGK